MKSLFYLIVFCFGLHYVAIAQNKISSDTIKKVVTKTIPKTFRPKKPNPISQEIGVGISLNSNGWTFGVSRGFMKLDEPIKTAYLFFNISETRHPKEYKQTNELFSTFNPNEPKPLPYKYGKINNFYRLDIGYAIKKPISNRLDNKSVEINYVLGAGLSLGFLKPYYLQLFTDTLSNVSPMAFEKYSDENARRFLNLTKKQTIIGAADVTNGFSEIMIKPGLVLKAGFLFDYAFSKKSFMSIELGASTQLYTSKIPILATIESRSYFFMLYADVKLGKRWPKRVVEDYDMEEF